ncbi:Os04g0512250 [Oryza sativa Japonica Group]|uniref:Os04g0512250 protein n=1 Tax=Oryza sativa subsp. japonica TaxID=39947 RepID=A0A0P0WCC0_ORYSJ|nr:hypothetical protein EE612_024363 [Oryza sativa]BAS90046.1 Os04g0512250 [Oryza sativa Japonica Group]
MVQLLTLWKSNLLQSLIDNAWRPSIVSEPRVAQIHVQAIILVMISFSLIIFQLILINSLDLLQLDIIMITHYLNTACK